MVESDEECERACLVPAEDSKEISPPISPVKGKILATPPSPTSLKVSSSGGGSLSSRTLNKPSIAPSLTPIPVGGSSRYLNVNQKLGSLSGSLSRRPSILSDNSARTPKETNNFSTKMSNMKKDSDMRMNLDPGLVMAPPNTPNPSDSRGTVSSVDLEKHAEIWQYSSATSSQQTTKAVASESDKPSEEKGSSETLKTGSCTGGVGGGGIQADALNYLSATHTGHTGLRSMGSTAFIKSMWARTNQRNVQHHSFFTDTTDVRQMEQALLQLLEDFHSGKLRAFAKDGSMEQMQGIREQQERLARLHFDLGARQELYAPLSDEGLRANQDNMRHLMSSLQQLSQSIEKLHLFSRDSNE